MSGSNNLNASLNFICALAKMLLLLPLFISMSLEDRVLLPVFKPFSIAQ